jgi:DNA-directed RNA polymerase subunit RPC12/RpoP
MKQNGYQIVHESLSNQPDKFDKFRKTMGTEKVDNFLAQFGLGPNYIPQQSKKYECPRCHKMNATYVEEHPDTDMNEMVLKCPDCGYSSDQVSESLTEGDLHILSVPENKRTFRMIRAALDDNEHRHHLRLTCCKCGGSETCRCSAPKTNYMGICERCEDPVDFKCPKCGYVVNVNFDDMCERMMTCPQCGEAMKEVHS